MNWVSFLSAGIISVCYLIWSFSLYTCCFVLLLASLLLFITVSLWDVWVWMYMHYSTCESPETLWSRLSVFAFMWLLGLELRLTDLHGKCFICWAIALFICLFLRLCLRQMSLRFSKLFIWSPFLYLPHPEIVGMFLSTRFLYPCFSEQMVFKCLSEASILLRLNVS